MGDGTRLRHGSHESNANGSNDGLVATLQTAVAGTNPLIMTSTLGGNVANGVSVTSAVFSKEDASDGR